MHALSECASNLWAYYGHAWWCWQPRSVCQNDLLVCPLINYSLEAAGRLAGSNLAGRPAPITRLIFLECAWVLLVFASEQLAHMGPECV